MWFLFSCISGTDEICYQIPLLYFPLLCHIKLGLEVEGDWMFLFQDRFSFKEHHGNLLGWRWIRAMHHGPQPNGYQGCVKNLTWVLQPLVGSAGSSLSHSSSQCLSFKLCLSRSISELVGISIAQSNQQKDQLLLAFKPYQGTFNHHSFTNRTFRFARQYNGPTKPSPAPRTLQPDAELNWVFSQNTV